MKNPKAGIASRMDSNEIPQNVNVLPAGVAVLQDERIVAADARLAELAGRDLAGQRWRELPVWLQDDDRARIRQLPRSGAVGYRCRALVGCQGRELVCRHGAGGMLALLDPVTPESVPAWCWQRLGGHIYLVACTAAAGARERLGCCPGPEAGVMECLAGRRSTKGRIGTREYQCCYLPEDAVIMTYIDINLRGA